ncbi:MAG: type II toxin-antitoxin system prevent-host-death family antitoxin [Myxococcales bacterium]|nr:type II toxin-antitoxin system prevent-host-death family antitoxin [Myxococcales bacterium]
MKPKRQVVGARELKMRLGKYIRAVREGETIVVTERGEAVAELRPLPSAATPLDAHLDALEAAGVLTRGSGEPLPPFRPVRLSGPPISQTLIEDREDRV